MLPGPNGQLWSLCARRITEDLDTERALEDRPTSAARGKERRRELKGGPRNVVIIYEICVTKDVQLDRWTCQARRRRGWLRIPLTCEACEPTDQVKPVARNGICVLRREEGNAFTWADVSGSELGPSLVLQARDEEIEQSRAHQVYEKVKEKVSWAVTGKAPGGTRWIDINEGGAAKPEYRSRLVAQQITCNLEEKNIFADAPTGGSKTIVLNGRHRRHRIRTGRA